MQFAFEPRNLPPAGAYFCRGWSVVRSQLSVVMMPTTISLTSSRTRAMKPAMASISGLEQLAGSRLARSFVNLGFQLDARLRCAELAQPDPVQVQERTLRRLVKRAAARDLAATMASIAIRTVADFQRAVPIRTYESLWDAYLRDAIPCFDDLTWPGRIPFLALTSGTTEGATKYIPVSDGDGRVQSQGRPDDAGVLPSPRSLIRGYSTAGLFVLGGSTELERTRSRRSSRGT